MRTMCSLMVAWALCSSGCVLRMPLNAVEGSGAVVVQQRAVSDFDGIVLNGQGDLTVLVGQPTSVTVQIDDNLLELVQTEVYDGRLVIKNLGSYRSEHGLHMEITVPSLTYLNIAGAGDVQIDGLQSDDFEVEVNGSGDLFGRGSVKHMSVEISGSADVDFADIAATDASVSINGSGDVRVHAVEHLSASIRGSGNIRYSGSPEVTRSVLGSGDIRQLAE
jgi:hypothetical protein